ncbi:hypothetical protein BJ508DRAFT_359648 [Ascobolus immersus RN42]|uniref:Uncharacterized protein n=1 Tax=Ascobolus immersus RN42 TaxID=1160509 RepID=A0A3N4IER5_ASCIM|nr:hypothetical protein BJ508DRAFT_359648 [Ascobolus immersus RN42]
MSSYRTKDDGQHLHCEWDAITGLDNVCEECYDQVRAEKMRELDQKKRDVHGKEIAAMVYQVQQLCDLERTGAFEIPEPVPIATCVECKWDSDTGLANVCNDCFKHVYQGMLRSLDEEKRELYSKELRHKLYLLEKIRQRDRAGEFYIPPKDTVEIMVARCSDSECNWDPQSGFANVHSGCYSAVRRHKLEQLDEELKALHHKELKHKVHYVAKERNRIGDKTFSDELEFDDGSACETLMGMLTEIQKNAQAETKRNESSFQEILHNCKVAAFQEEQARLASADASKTKEAIRVAMWVLWGVVLAYAGAFMAGR